MSELYEDTVYGQILPLEWNNDRVSAITILVDGEEEFIVEPDKNCDKLVDHIDRWVTAEGIIRETTKELRIKIRTFKLEDELDFDGDDDW